ncbi:MAG: hypothetical protein FWH23_00710 [Bacteroidales bacterium]|nr:hypothetical protein [Bacteroidales bacterium]MCL2132991.1 hypothetical protein [Bacteroidales bacterium]
MFYKILNGGFIALSLLCAHTAQAQVCATVGNIIKSVSLSKNGAVYDNLITWDIPATLPPNANGYIIYEYKGGAECTVIITTINNLSATSYADAGAGLTTKSYAMAINTTTEPEPITQQHAKAVITAVDFDPCTYEAEIHWTPYTGWEEEDTEYAVLWGGWESSATLVEQLSAASYVWQNPPTRQNDTIWLVARNKNDITAVSIAAPYPFYFDAPHLPVYICLSELQDNGGNHTLTFEIDPNTQLTDFEVQRATDSGEFSSIFSFNDKNLSNYTDAAGLGLFRYRIVAKNACGNVVCTSNEIVNIQLQILLGENNWQLQWLHANPNLIEVYTLDRIQPNSENLLTYSPATTYIDPIPTMLDASLQFCYTITGISVNITAVGLPCTSIVSSSENCVYYRPTVTMPDAVDPLSRVVNPQTGRARNQFGPIINADPRSYSYRLTILNRNGAVVADIVKNIDDNPLDKSWDGHLKNGNQGPEEVYTYHLSVDFEGGNQQIMTGTVVVVYSE